MLRFVRQGIPVHTLLTTAAEKTDTSGGEIGDNGSTCCVRPVDSREAWASTELTFARWGIR